MDRRPLVLAMALAMTATLAPAAEKPHRRVPQQAPGTQQLWNDLVHGSAEQQAMERKDRDMSTVKPIDHHKDDFFSDWRGLK